MYQILLDPVTTWRTINPTIKIAANTLHLRIPVLMILKGRSSAETKGCKPLVCYKIYIMLVIMVWSNLWSAEYSFVLSIKDNWNWNTDDVIQLESRGRAGARSSSINETSQSGADKAGSWFISR